MASDNIKEESLSETATNIMQKANKSIFKGIMGGGIDGLDF